MAERGSGRTTRQLAALPDGGVFLVAHSPMADHCRRLLADSGREVDALRILPMRDFRDTDRLRGTARGTAWDIDHAFYEAGGRSDVADVARRILER